MRVPALDRGWSESATPKPAARKRSPSARRPPPSTRPTLAKPPTASRSARRIAIDLHDRDPAARRGASAAMIGIREDDVRDEERRVEIRAERLGPAADDDAGREADARPREHGDEPPRRGNPLRRARSRPSIDEHAVAAARASTSSCATFGFGVSASGGRVTTTRASISGCAATNARATAAAGSPDDATPRRSSTRGYRSLAKLSRFMTSSSSSPGEERKAGARSPAAPRTAARACAFARRAQRRARRRRRRTGQGDGRGKRLREPLTRAASSAVRDPAIASPKRP